MNLFRSLLIVLPAVVLMACGGGGGSPGATTGSQPPAPTPLFTNAPATLTAAVGGAQEFFISSGKPPYSATSDNPTVVSAGVSDSKLTIGGVATGVANVFIRDAIGTSISTVVTVKSATLRDLFTTADSGVVIPIGSASAQVYTVGGGTGPYTATSGNTNVVSVALVGGNMTVTGLSTGSTSIVVSDKVGASKTVPVTVQSAGNIPLFTTAPAAGVTIAVGTPTVYGVGGGSGSGYGATSSNSGVATVSLVDKNLTVTGVAFGSAVITVRDSSGASPLTFNVTVGSAPVVVAPVGATGIINDDLVATITGGTPPYRASVGNSLVASASVVNANELRIKLLQVGKTIVTVLDANNQSATYTVDSGASTPGIRLSPGAVTVSELDTQPIIFTVFGAAPGTINAFSSDVTKLTATVTGQTVTVTTGTSGNRCVPSDSNVTITVIDSTRASGVATITIKDNGNKTAGVPANPAATPPTDAIAADPCPP